MSRQNTDKKMIKPEATWEKELPQEVFNITRKKGTERAFTGEYEKLYEQGKYHCRCCDVLLFDSETKYDSGSGWPSFYDVHTNNITEKNDSAWMMQRVELVCNKCDAHLGHVFEDGPQPTGLRYCINSASLSFKKESES